MSRVLRIWRELKKIMKRDGDERTAELMTAKVPFCLADGLQS